ncbi:polysaccharide export protein [Amylibacter sp.]|nr:polysaccharide export protein [Amylibacter sp.]
MRKKFVICIALLMTNVLVGCFVPRSTGLVEEITYQNSDKPINFKKHEVDLDFMKQYTQNSETKISNHEDWPSGQVSQRVTKEGDTFNISIWETASSSLYLVIGQKNIAFPPIRVDQNGNIQIPYADAIKVSGLTNLEATKLIKQVIKSISPSAEVQVEIISGPENSYSLTGDIAIPGTYKLPIEKITVKEVIALAGGVAKGTRNPYLKLERSNKIYHISFRKFLENTSYNIPILPKDFIRVEADRREFQVLGSTGKGQVIQFDTDRISVRKAIATAGGLDSGKSNPEGILLLRNNTGSVLINEKRNMPEIFIFNLTSAESIFAADEFLIEPNDLIMMTESPVPSLQVMLGLIAMGANLIK